MKRNSAIAKVLVLSMLMLFVASLTMRPTYAAKPAISAIVFQDSFESGFNSWTTNGTVAQVSSPVAMGSYAARATGPDSYWSTRLGSSYSDLYFEGFVQIPAGLPNGQKALFLYIQDSSYSNVVAGGILVDNSGNSYWLLRVNNNWYTPPNPSNVQTNNWYFIEIEYNTAGTANLWIDGTLQCSAAGQILPNNAQVLQGGNPFMYTPSGFISYADYYFATTKYMVTSLPGTPTPSPTPTPTPAPTPAPVPPTNTSIAFQNGFENGFNSWTIGGTVAQVTSPVASGTYAAQATGPNSYWSTTLNSGYTDLFFKGSIRIPSALPNGQRTLSLYILDNSYSNIVAGGLEADGSGSTYWLLRVNNNYFLSNAFTLQTNHWYVMKIEYNTAGTANLWIDGSLMASASGQTLTNNAQVIQGGNPFSYTPTGFVSYGDAYSASYANSSAPVSSPPPSQSPPPPSSSGVPWLHTSGQNVYDSSGKQVKLYTAVIQDGDGNHITQTDIQKIRSMGFNAIRVFLEWQLVQPNGPNSVNTGYFTSGGSPTIGASVDNVVSWAAQAGMYVILTPAWTSYWTPPSWALTASGGKGLTNGDGGGAIDLLYNSQIQAGVNYLYQWMGQHYAASSNVIFEGFNELSTSNNSDGGSAFANFNNGWISAVEKGEGSNSHLKIVEFLLSSAWTEIFTAPYVSGSHSNIMLATHNYSPMNSWNPSDPNYGTSYVLQRLQADANAAHSAGLPWIDTEWSKDTTQSQWQVFYTTMLQGYSQYNAAGWAFFCYDSNSGAQSTWNLNGAIGSAILSILQPAMVQP